MVVRVSGLVVGRRGGGNGTLEGLCLPGGFRLLSDLRGPHGDVPSKLRHSQAAPGLAGGILMGFFPGIPRQVKRQLPPSLLGLCQPFLPSAGKTQDRCIGTV